MIWVYLLIANVAMLAHLAFIGFLFCGGFLAWRRPRLLWLHLATAVWAFGIETWHWTCPLTEIEDWARRAAGQPGLADTGFIDTYIKGVLYPAELNSDVLRLAALIVLVSWLGFLAITWRRYRSRPQSSRV